MWMDEPHSCTTKKKTPNVLPAPLQITTYMYDLQISLNEVDNVPYARHTKLLLN
jgi:hypothetical protein